MDCADLVCSAMGKTTNNLLAAADEAINDGKVDLSAVRDLHAETAKLLNLEETSEYGEVKELIDECERILEGVSMLGELSPRTRDRVVSYGERLSGRMVAAPLTLTPDVPATQIESWDLGVLTTPILETRRSWTLAGRRSVRRSTRSSRRPSA